MIQELIAPPYIIVLPDGALARTDDEARAFFKEMICNGFSYWLSEEDTGPGATNHKNNPRTEWWVTFYKPESIRPAIDLPWGFLDSDRSANTHYDRVPYAFPFRSVDSSIDFVLVSVHLSRQSSERRNEELEAIADWISQRDNVEKDFIVLGDMNIESLEELRSVIPPGFVSLNQDCSPTNTATTPKPYDHVFYRPDFSKEVQDDLLIMDLVNVIKPYWKSYMPYPGDPYDYNEFRVIYSDHCPIVFTLSTSGGDDD